MKNNYESVYKNVGTTPRTMNEAFKNADYATPIWRCETENENGFKFFVDMMLGAIMVGLPLIMLYGVAVWLGMVK